MQRFIFTISLLIASIAAAYAEAGGGPSSTPPPGEGDGSAVPSAGGGMLWIWLLPLGLLVVLMLSSSRAQKREARQRQELIDSVKVGDKVITIGGMHGQVVRKGEGVVDLKLGDGPVITFNQSAVASVVGREDK